MNTLRLITLSFLLALFVRQSFGQTFYQHDTTVSVFAYGNKLSMAWCGGFNNPQFSIADLDHDGRQDLVVYENGLGVSTFINIGISSGLPQYCYDPRYALNFPPIYSYLLMADYNCDGIQDLFQRGPDGFAAYRGYYNANSQLCFTFYRTLLYSNDPLSGGTANAFVNPGDIPAVKDVDGDGDLDFVSYYITGGYMYYYKNLRVEQGLPCDTIRIDLKDRCWGKVYQGFYRSHTLGYSCDNSGLRPAGKQTHSGNSICLFDWDMDGDMDYLDGSVSFNEITFLKNGRIELGADIDTMIYQDTTWQSGGKVVEIPTWPAAFNVDVDLDGNSDLLIAPNGGGGENYHCIWYYHNNSSPGSPDWRFQSDSFLVDRSIDLGTGTYPALFDYDKDGKLDLIVGSDGYRQSTGVLKSTLSLYLNTSVTGDASFTLNTKDLAGLGTQNFQGLAPAIGDIDNDGRSDLVVGHIDGTMSYYKNMAASETVQPDWQLVQLTLKDQSGNTINVGGNAAPFIYDIDKDGKKDLIIGSIYGYVQYYQNITTTAGTIKLKLVTTRLGKAKADPNQNFGNYSVPFIGKIDSSGEDYLLLGSNSGNIYCYTGFQSGDTTATYTLVDAQYSFIDSTNNLYNSPGTFYGVYGNHRSSLTVGDVDGSGSYSLIAGNIRGGLEFYKRKVYISETTDVSRDAKLLVYPNPVAQTLNISWRDILNGNLTLRVINAAGQVCMATTLPAISGYTTLDVSTLPQGLYFCVMEGSSGRLYSKFTVLR